VLDYLERRRLPTVGTEPLRRAGGVRRVLRGLVDSGVVTRYAGGTEPVYLVGPDQHLVAGFYANGANHFLVVRAIAEVVLQAAAEERFAEPVRDGRRAALALRDLLKFEYFFADRDEFREELRAEFDLIDPAWEEKLTTPEGVAATLATMRPLLGHRVLHAIADAYLVFGERLAAHDPRQAVDPEELRQECLAVARQYRMQQRISSSEAISAELFDNALALARNRDLVDPGREELAERRASFAAELRRFARLVAQVGELARRELPDPSLIA
jgi:glycerol-3-phosphate O-acyltransferase